MLTPVLEPYQLGCTCPVVEYAIGSMWSFVRPQCPVHAHRFPPLQPTERERYEAAMRIPTDRDGMEAVVRG